MPDARRADPTPFIHPVRIYWEDTDAGGVVFYANYLKFFERARTEWLRARGWEQEKLRQEAGVMFVVVQTAVRYRQPARLDDQLDITVALRHAAPASLHFMQQALRQGTLVAEGDIKIGCVDATTFRPRRIPAELLQETTT
ncbi:tol-pal system-associated acyl-CoA thioesterase [Aquabacterium sp. A7-Y]|uniref:tol-pal system-associated acyl-CoA thioesterase n=1 Tax=Aquabacterium sp. A7-Y TaxID=1349605 RepID=UPI00223E8ABB|nr:tol-pal system-associated acyl-CoA thioesterase [Aquabacterium sp. A7-Y]MCW7539163.1 tol-pal system-associated acyl-CoA thioesterase [Aquabacterium sp. A7-Y]